MSECHHLGLKVYLRCCKVLAVACGIIRVIMVGCRELGVTSRNTCTALPFSTFSGPKA